MKNNNLCECAICHKKFNSENIVHGGIIRNGIFQLIKNDDSSFQKTSIICLDDLHYYQNIYVQKLLETEKGELTLLENEVLNTIQEREFISTNPDNDFDKTWTKSELVADKIASFGGSWTFIGIFIGFIIVWIMINSMVFLWKPADPYPYVLLNLLLSCLAAIQAPIIMMSQNRQEMKDRIRSQHDYQVNLKSELEIRQLHEKIDHLLMHQWERLAEIQEIQLDLLEEIRKDQKNINHK